MSAEIYAFPTEEQTQEFLLREIHRDAHALFISAQKADDKRLRNEAAKIIGMASYEIFKLEALK